MNKYICLCLPKMVSMFVGSKFAMPSVVQEAVRDPCRDGPGRSRHTAIA